MFDALFRRFSITARIIIVALLFCLLLLFLFPFMRASFDLSNDRIQAFSRTNLPATSMLLDTANLIANSELRAMQALADRRVNILVAESGALADLETAQQRLAELQALSPAPAEGPQGPLAGIAAEIASMQVAARALDAALAQNDLEGVAEQVNEVRSSGDRARGLILDQVNTQRQSLDAQATAGLNRWGELSTALTALFIGMFPLAVLLALIVGRTITTPLSRVKEAVDAFSQGNQDAIAPVRGRNEISSLAQSINKLFNMLSRSNQEMRQEVEERTIALANRAIQLQTAAQITRDAAAIPELEGLLNRVVNLVRERFDFYYVGIFLLDTEGRYAIMRAGSGEAGQILRARGFRLRVGEPNLIGQVTMTGEERIVPDVSADFTHQREPLLPLTRSEVVLPLKIGSDHVIGALDVQSAALNAFESETLSVLQIMADQLAVVIENSRLSAALTQAQQEAGTLLQRYTQETWSGLAASQRLSGYRFDMIEVQPFASEDTNPLVASALSAPAQDGSTLAAGKAEVVSLENGGSLLRAPLILYNQVVGMVGLEEDDPDRSWSDDDVKILEALTSQVSLALENARLLDEAQRRTSQLRLLQEVTAAASSTTELAPLFETVTQALCNGLGLDFVGAVVFGTRVPGFNPGQMRFGATRQDDASMEQLQSLAWEIHAIPAVRSLVESGRSIVIPIEGEARQLGNAAFLLEQVGITRLLLQPILYRGQVVGLLDLHTTAQGAMFGSETQNLMDQVTLQLASAIEVALSFAQATRRAEQERKMTAVIQRMRETLDIPTILRTAAQEIRSSLVANAGGLGEEGSPESVRTSDSPRTTEVIVRLGAEVETPPAKETPEPPANGKGSRTAGEGK